MMLEPRLRPELEEQSARKGGASTERQPRHSLLLFTDFTQSKDNGINICPPMHCYLRASIDVAQM
jgi:hypothetical protein